LISMNFLLRGGIEVHSSSTPVAESSSMPAKRQRSYDVENPGPNKKARVAPGPGGRIMPLPPPVPKSIMPLMFSLLTMQLNYLGRRGRHVTLRASSLKVNATWIRTLHYLSFFLVDELLEVLWYEGVLEQPRLISSINCRSLWSSYKHSDVLTICLVCETQRCPKVLT